MAESLVSQNLEGRDVEAPAKTESESAGRGAILLSMVGPDWNVYHAAILLPTSYQACFL